jgi:hypothetical protein
MTEKEKYLAWEKDAKENKGLIETHITLNPYIKTINEELEEKLYKELNHWNEQMDNKSIKPRIEVKCYSEEEIYKELNEMNKAVEEGKFEEITFL